MKTKSIFLSIVISIFVSILLLNCSNGSSDSSSNSKKVDKTGNNFYAEIVKSDKGDFRGVSLNFTTPDYVKRIEEKSANTLENDLNLNYSYELDNYNRYDVKYVFTDEVLSMISLSYYSYENDGNKAYQNGKEIYDELFADFKAKYGEPKKYAEQSYIWNTKSSTGVEMTVKLMNTGKKGASGTVQILFYK